MFGHEDPLTFVYSLGTSHSSNDWINAINATVWVVLLNWDWLIPAYHHCMLFKPFI